MNDYDKEYVELLNINNQDYLDICKSIGNKRINFIKTIKRVLSNKLINILPVDIFYFYETTDNSTNLKIYETDIKLVYQDNVLTYDGQQLPINKKELNLYPLLQYVLNVVQNILDEVHEQVEEDEHLAQQTYFNELIKLPNLSEGYLLDKFLSFRTIKIEYFINLFGYVHSKYTVNVVHDTKNDYFKITDMKFYSLTGIEYIISGNDYLNDLKEIEGILYKVDQFNEVLSDIRVVLNKYEQQVEEETTISPVMQLFYDKLAVQPRLDMIYTYNFLTKHIHISTTSFERLFNLSYNPQLNEILFISNNFIQFISKYDSIEKTHTYLNNLLKIYSSLINSKLGEESVTYFNNYLYKILLLFYENITTYIRGFDLLLIDIDKLFNIIDINRIKFNDYELLFNNDELIYKRIDELEPIRTFNLITDSYYIENQLQIVVDDLP